MSMWSTMDFSLFLYDPQIEDYFWAILLAIPLSIIIKLVLELKNNQNNNNDLKLNINDPVYILDDKLIKIYQSIKNNRIIDENIINQFISEFMELLLEKGFSDDHTYFIATSFKVLEILIIKNKKKAKQFYNYNYIEALIYFLNYPNKAYSANLLQVLLKIVRFDKRSKQIILNSKTILQIIEILDNLENKNFQYYEYKILCEVRSFPESMQYLIPHLKKELIFQLYENEDTEKDRNIICICKSLNIHCVYLYNNIFGDEGDNNIFNEYTYNNINEYNNIIETILVLSYYENKKVQLHSLDVLFSYIRLNINNQNLLKQNCGFIKRISSILDQETSDINLDIRIKKTCMFIIHFLITNPDPCTQIVLNSDAPQKANSFIIQTLEKNNYKIVHNSREQSIIASGLGILRGVVTNGTQKHRNNIVKEGCLKYLSKLLFIPSLVPGRVYEILFCLEGLLKAGNKSENEIVDLTTMDNKPLCLNNSYVELFIENNIFSDLAKFRNENKDNINLALYDKILLSIILSHGETYQLKKSRKSYK
ncbi:hypothetical protein DICPUDRAFT_83475 [Dictyostelium purpureum]|uniref:Uncharacterized protein n=1 Tax=Dictyostelium purpureum TaxID=5786 RepID=F0ZZN3_DICPU|nr:uncharacterized protein DICPUDRAFT_83475 [Dictyostelium purpureum]EGC30593.1 hypothetical protein DICPUDRAFT_83475 [Dictyostelium purpureum]|eukprot:XP_003292881.1 hypothetical protein DICPUDRAFT_83475 [Dictyostelium purpureum]